MIRLDIEKQQEIINGLFGNSENSFFQIIKTVEKEYPLPKFKEAYYEFVGTADEYSEKIYEYDNVCLLRDILIKRLADEFVQLHERERNDPTNQYWVLSENELDFSIESLSILDKNNTYTNYFKQSFCNSHLLPLLTGYVLHTILKNTVQHGWEVRYENNIYHTLFKPSAGSKEIVPCDYIKTCFYSGFKFTELHNCLQSNVVGLSEIYKPWRRQYLSENSNP